MTVALILLAVAVLFAALGGGFALGLHLFRPHMPRKKRIAWSAGLAAFLPMILPFVGFLVEGADYTADGATDSLLGFLALLSAMVMAGLVFCLPSAWWVTSRMHGTAPHGADGDASGTDRKVLEDRQEDRDVALDEKMEPRAV